MSHVTSAVRTPLVTGGKTYADVTEDISRQVEGAPTREWTIAFTISVVVLHLRNRLCILDLVGRLGRLGLEQNSWLGMGYYQLRMVGRYRSRRYTDLSNSAAVPSEMADGSKPGG